MVSHPLRNANVPTVIGRSPRILIRAYAGETIIGAPVRGQSWVSRRRTIREVGESRVGRVSLDDREVSVGFGVEPESEDPDVTNFRDQRVRKLAGNRKVGVPCLRIVQVR